MDELDLWPELREFPLNTFTSTVYKEMKIENGMDWEIDRL
jgi:hypothetical protein